MHAFEVSRNGKRLCVAGVGQDGVLTAIVSLVIGKPVLDLDLSVGGLISSPRRHVYWAREKGLSVGDEIHVRIIESDSIDDPEESELTDPAKDLKYRKSYVRPMAKQFGWKLQTKPGRPRLKKRKKR